MANASNQLLVSNGQLRDEGLKRVSLFAGKRIQAQLRLGKGMLKVARECGVGSGTVQRVKQEMQGPFVDPAA